MSGQLRICFAGFVLAGGLWTTPSLSNPLAELFNTTPRQDAATSSAKAECLPRPGNTTADGAHWVYRFDGHRKCWFQTEGTATVRKGVNRTTPHRVVRADKTESAPGKAVVDAHAELQRATPPEASQPRSPASTIKVADEVSTASAGMAATPATAPFANRPTAQLAPEQSVEVRTFLAMATDDAAAMPVGLPVAEADDDGSGRAATWLGALLMTLGLVLVIRSSRAGDRRLAPSYVGGARALQGRTTKLEARRQPG
jgi:hypothetical protein